MKALEIHSLNRIILFHFQKFEGMKITTQALHFDADVKLLEFIEKKLQKLLDKPEVDPHSSIIPYG